MHFKAFVTFFLQEEAVMIRIINGIHSFQKAVELAPEVWLATLMRLLFKPETHAFIFDVLSALLKHTQYKIPEAFWLCISRYLREKVHPTI